MYTSINHGIKWNIMSIMYYYHEYFWIHQLKGQPSLELMDPIKVETDQDTEVEIPEEEETQEKVETQEKEDQVVFKLVELAWCKMKIEV